MTAKAKYKVYPICMAATNYQVVVDSKDKDKVGGKNKDQGWQFRQELILTAKTRNRTRKGSWQRPGLELRLTRTRSEVKDKDQD